MEEKIERYKRIILKYVFQNNVNFNTDNKIIDSLLLNSTNFNPSGLSINSYQNVNLNKKEISEILEFDNICLLINYKKIDEFICFVSGKRKLLIEKKISKKNIIFDIYKEQYFILKVSLRKTIMKNGNSYFIYKSISF